MELREKSMFDVIKENLTRKKRMVYIHRLIYIFSYQAEQNKRVCRNDNDYESLADEVVESMMDERTRQISEAAALDEFRGSDHTSSIYEQTDEIKGDFFEFMESSRVCNYQDERLTGILFKYDDSVGIHILEGSDAMFIKHIEGVYKKPSVLKQIKLICTSHHINRRMVTKWHNLSVSPLYFGQPIENPKNEEEICELYNTFLNFLSEMKNFIRYGENSNQIHYPERMDQLNQIPSDILAKQFEKILPPSQLIKLLLNLPILEDLSIYAARLEAIPRPIPYHETIWPLPTDHVPDFHDVLLEKGESFYDYVMHIKEKQ